MTTADDTPDEEAHGVSGGATRDDGQMQEEPGGTTGQDEETWAEATETGGEAAS